MSIDIRRLKEIIEVVLQYDNEGEGLEVVTTGHYGEPHEYDETDFCVKTVDVDEGLNPIKPRKVFNIESKDIGPEPD